MLILLLITLEAPLRMQKTLLTTPINAYEFTPIDSYEDLFLSYPLIQIKNDSIYFRNSNKILLLLDGIPISSIKDIPIPAIQKIETIAQNTTLYGDYTAVINIITKKREAPRHKEGSRISAASPPKADSIPYSNIKLNKNPDNIQAELGRNLFTQLNLYSTMDLNSKSKWSANIQANTKFFNLRTHYISTTGVNIHASIMNKFRAALSKDYCTASMLSKFKNHALLLGTEWSASASGGLSNHSTAFFIQDYFEPRPLLYIVPTIRYEIASSLRSSQRQSVISPQIAIGFIPQFNIIIFTTISQTQLNIGTRVFDSAISLSKNMENKDNPTFNATIASPVILNCKITASASGADHFPDSATVIAQYKKEFKKGKIGLYILADARTQNLRAEIRIIDAKIFYRVNPSYPSYGLSWQFRD